MIVNHLFSATVSPDKPLLYFAEHDTQLTNIALDPSSSKPSSSTKAVEPVIVKIEYEGPKIEGEHSDDEDEDKSSEEDEDDDGDDTGFVPVENKQVVICSLIPGQILQAQVNLLLVEDEQYRFVVTGGAYDVHLLGHYVSQPADLDSDLSPSDYYDSDDSLASDELGQYSESDVDLHSKLGLIEGPVYSEDEDSDDDDDDVSYDSEDEDEEGSSDDDAEGRIQELKDEAKGLKDEASSPVIVPAAGAKAGLPNGTASKKRPLANDVMDDDDADEAETGAAADVSMATSDKSAGEVDMSKLSKNQRKKLAKKLKAANGQAVAPPVASSPVAPTAAAAPAVAAKKEASVAAPKKESGEEKPDKKQPISLPSGLKIHDSKPGSGPSCKPGQKVSMRYIGKLTTGKTFDKNTKGDPFRFTLGKGEVIKGWDEGVKGMKVGGERKLIVPADLAYGKRGAPPDIPSNATLVFEVKLLKIN